LWRADATISQLARITTAVQPGITVRAEIAVCSESDSSIQQAKALRSLTLIRAIS
jgi:hypothetical protein